MDIVMLLTVFLFADAIGIIYGDNSLSLSTYIYMAINSI